MSPAFKSPTVGSRSDGFLQQQGAKQAAQVSGSKPGGPVVVHASGDGKNLLGE